MSEVIDAPERAAISTELVDLPPKESALAIYSSVGGLDQLIDQIRAKVVGMSGGTTVLVADLVGSHGISSLGVVVLAAGATQVLLGALRLGRWFQAISPAVVQGLLAGIGLVLLLGQIYPMLGATQPSTVTGRITALPELLRGAPAATWGLGLLSLVVLVGWERLPARVRLLPGALVAVLLGAAGLLLIGGGAFLQWRGDPQVRETNPKLVRALADGSISVPLTPTQADVDALLAP